MLTSNQVVRGVFCETDVRSIRLSAREIYAHIFGTTEPKAGANTLHLSDVAKQSPVWMAQFVNWVIERFTHSEAFRIYRGLYGTNITFPLLKCIVRYQRPDHVASFLPFHQDADGDKLDTHMINCWTALDECGADAPGIEVVNTPLTTHHPELFLYETLDKAGDQVWHTQAGAVLEQFGHIGVTRPVFRAGDGIVFDHLAMHRTYITPSMSKPRMSIEIRAAKLEAYHAAYGEVDRVDLRGQVRRMTVLKSANRRSLLSRLFPAVN
jgi:hypothetical protein